MAAASSSSSSSSSSNVVGVVALFLALNLLLVFSPSPAAMAEECDPGILDKCIALLLTKFNQPGAVIENNWDCCTAVSEMLEANNAACGCAALQSSTFDGIFSDASRRYTELLKECGHGTTSFVCV